MGRLLFVTSWWAAGIALAYPIPPQTIWSLSARSELIVVGRIRKNAIEPTTPRTARFAPSHRAHIDVVEVLSGPPLVDFSVPYLASSSNGPAPARFIEGETALLFLSRYQDEWAVPALSYGARYPPDAVSLAELRSLVGLALIEQRAGAKEPSLAWPKHFGRAGNDSRKTTG
ncbi:MAG: hypothetical protein SFW67_08000 [Myxococcaceae bacterium]|nr:hypothetical protein [Myxococcaceae bacterium]